MSIADTVRFKGPHAHYHQFSVVDGRLAELHEPFLLRAAEIARLVRALGARSILDIGSNLGGFLFFLEAHAGVEHAVGYEPDTGCHEASERFAEALRSRARVVRESILAAPRETFDAVLLQNVYHHLYEQTGDHDRLWSHLAGLGRYVVSYNPFSTQDPVVRGLAASNRAPDWERFTFRDTCVAAVRSGFLLPLPLDFAFRGMGSERAHLLFVRDDPHPLSPARIAWDPDGKTKLEVREWHVAIHQRFYDEEYFYKVFLRPRPIARVVEAVASGFYDRAVVGDLDWLTHGEEIIGYRQPRGIPFEENGTESERLAEYHTALWRIVSRALRHDRFLPDLCTENFVQMPGREGLAFVDLEMVLHSLLQVPPDSRHKARLNLALPSQFPDVPLTDADFESNTTLYWKLFEGCTFGNAVREIVIAREGARAAAITGRESPRTT